MRMKASNRIYCTDR